MNKTKELEAYLFIKGEPQLKKDIEKILDCTDRELETYIAELKEQYKDRGITIVESVTEISLTTAPEVALFVEKIEKEERGGELSKASLETLSIVLYKDGVTRSEIDYIRGVNSSFILRNLYLRGLIAKKDGSARSPVYVPTVSLLSFLGITHGSELPEYDTFSQKITESVENTQQESIQ